MSKMDWSRSLESRGSAVRPDLDETVINGAPYGHPKPARGGVARSESAAKAVNENLAEDLRRRALRMMRAR